MSNRDGGMAFPLMTDDTWYKGLSMRDYFAAHAPAEPWAWFWPTLPELPRPPSAVPIVNEGEETATDKEIADCHSWRNDPDGGIDAAELTKFSRWVQRWRDYWLAKNMRKNIEQRERNIQWPWFYADTMLANRERNLPK